MATENIYKNLDGNRNQLINWSAERLAADPTGADLYAGRSWFNTATNTMKYFDGTDVQTLATLEDLTAIGTIQGVHDASTGVPSTTLDGSPISAGDFWRVSVAGTIAGIGGASDDLEVGDLIFALADGATTAGQFSAVQANLSLEGNISQSEEVTLATLPANTPTAIPTTLTNVYSVEAFDSANNRIGLCFAGPTTAVTAESSVALTGVKFRVVGS